MNDIIVASELKKIANVLLANKENQFKSICRDAFKKVYKCTDSEAEYETDVLWRCGVADLDKDAAIALLVNDGNWKKSNAVKFVDLIKQ